MRELIGYFSVDSGQVMIGDPCYLDKWGGHAFHTRVEWDSEKSHYVMEDGSDIPAELLTYDYNGACLASLGKDSAGVLGEFQPGSREGRSIVTSTGYGDGCYPVYAEYNHDGRISKIEIYFVSEEEEDEDDE